MPHDKVTVIGSGGAIRRLDAINFDGILQEWIDYRFLGEDGHTIYELVCEDDEMRHFSAKSIGNTDQKIKIQSSNWPRRVKYTGWGDKVEARLHKDGRLQFHEDDLDSGIDKDVTEFMELAMKKLPEVRVDPAVRLALRVLPLPIGDTIWQHYCTI